MALYRNRIIMKAFGILLAGCVTLAFLTVGVLSSAESDGENAPSSGDAAASTQKSAVHLYFAGRNGFFLTAEQRVILHPDNSVGLAGTIVNALIAGPQKGLGKTIPVDTQLKALYITPDGTGYVDLSATVRKNHSGGAKSELLTIYSIVNSLVLNVPDIKQVQILIDGNPAPTLAGHVDLQLPVKANMLLIR